MPIKGTGSRYGGGEFFVLCDACHVARFGANAHTPELAVAAAIADGFKMSRDPDGPPKFICRECDRLGFSANAHLCEVCGTSVRVRYSGPTAGIMHAGTGTNRKVVHAVCDLCQHRSQREVDDLFDKRMIAMIPQTLRGTTFCFTGKLSDLRERFWEMTRQHGGTVHDRVAHTTNYLVCGSRVGAVKMNAAATLGAKCISENEFLMMVEPRAVLPKEPNPKMMGEEAERQRVASQALLREAERQAAKEAAARVDPAERERRAQQARDAVDGASRAFGALEEVLSGSSSKR
jgi:hypothetical protein